MDFILPYVQEFRLKQLQFTTNFPKNVLKEIAHISFPHLVTLHLGIEYNKLKPIVKCTLFNVLHGSMHPPFRIYIFVIYLLKLDNNNITSVKPLVKVVFPQLQSFSIRIFLYKIKRVKQYKRRNNYPDLTIKWKESRQIRNFRLYSSRRIDGYQFPNDISLIVKLKHNPSLLWSSILFSKKIIDPRHKFYKLIENFQIFSFGI